VVLVVTLLFRPLEKLCLLTDYLHATANSPRILRSLCELTAIFFNFWPRKIYGLTDELTISRTVARSFVRGFDVLLHAAGEQPQLAQ